MRTRMKKRWPRIPTKATITVSTKNKILTLFSRSKTSVGFAWPDPVMCRSWVRSTIARDRKSWGSARPPRSARTRPRRLCNITNTVRTRRREERRRVFFSVIFLSLLSFPFNRHKQGVQDYSTMGMSFNDACNKSIKRGKRVAHFVLTRISGSLRNRGNIFQRPRWKTPLLKTGANFGKYLLPKWLARVFWSFCLAETVAGHGKRIRERRREISRTSDISSRATKRSCRLKIKTRTSRTRRLNQTRSVQCRTLFFFLFFFNVLTRDECSAYKQSRGAGQPWWFRNSNHGNPGEWHERA